MSNTKKYIRLNITNNDYEIYVITEDKKIKLSNKNALIMSKVIKKYPCKQINESTYIYPNIVPIMISFYKEKSKLKNKKVNRKKSRNIATSIILTISLAIGGGVLANKFEDRNNTNDKQSKVESYEDSYIPDTLPNIETTNSLYTEETNESIITLEKDKTITTEEIDSSDITYFNYEYDDIDDKESLENAKDYMDIFKKYEKIYGIDANLLCAIGAQESSGIHREYSVNGYATGLMGIENIWDGASLTVFNFETNEEETIIIDYSKIGDIDYNIKISAAIFQDCFCHTVKNDLNSIDESELLALAIQKYNMGPGNISKLFKISNDWINNREMITAGDSKYFEHILSRLDNGTIIEIKVPNNETNDTTVYITEINNIALEKQRPKF